jgi:hypothetical protein
MSSMFLLYASATASNILKAWLLGTDHVKNFTKVITLFVALNVINFSLFDLLCDHEKCKYLDCFYNFYIKWIYLIKDFTSLNEKIYIINN